MQAIVGAALRQRILVLILAVALMAGGLFAYKQLNIEAYPDPVPPMIEIVTQNPGQSSEEIERYITIPIEVQMAGIPFVTSIRTISLTGLSDVKVQFSYDLSYREASQLVINRLSQLGPLPNGAQPFIAPTSPIGEIFRYRVVGPPGFSVTDLKTIQDWILLRRLKSVSGVIDITSWGGKSKSFDITVDLDKLLAYGLTLKQVLDALNGANINVGANTVNLGPQSAVIRSVGQIRTMADIGHTMLTVRDGSPVLVSDVATITVGNEPRLGVAGQDNDDDIVQGIVLMRRGAETLPTLRAVEREVERINRSDLLPPGVRIERIYDRSVLVDVTTSTVLHNMVMVSLRVPHPVAVPGRSAQRADRLGHHPLRPAVRRRHPGAERRIGEPAVDGRHRFRHHRRRHRDHGREHLPPPRRAERRRPRGPPDAADAAWPHGQGGDDLSRLGRGHTGHLLLGHHHHRGLPAAVHPVGRRRPYLRADGQDLCLCAVGRPVSHLHRLARAGRRAAAGEGVGDRDVHRAPGAPPLSARHRPRAAAARPHPGDRRRNSWPARPLPPARSGWNSCPSSRRAISGCGRRCRRRCRSTRATSTPTACAGWSRASPKSRRSSPSTAGPTTAPIPTAFPMSSSSCR